MSDYGFLMDRLEGINFKIHRAEQNKSMHDFNIRERQRQFQDPMHETVYADKEEQAMRKVVMKDISLKKRLKEMSEER